MQNSLTAVKQAKVRVFGRPMRSSRWVPFGQCSRLHREAVSALRPLLHDDAGRFS